MKITIELDLKKDATATSINALESLIYALRQSSLGGADLVAAPLPAPNVPQAVPVHDPTKSVGAYGDPTQTELKENDLVISLGEGIMKEIVDLWEDEKLVKEINKADELRAIGCRPHSHKALIEFVRSMGSLSHAIHHVRVREGKEDSDWQRSEEIALNMTQISSIVYEELSHCYTEKFSWERGDPTYSLYQRAIKNV